MQDASCSRDGDYWSVFGIGIQNNLAYRVNFLARSLFGLIPVLAMIYLWRTIFEGQGNATIAGYTLGQMISYYLIVQIVDALTAVNEDDWQIASDIKDGMISQFLLKPVDYLWYRLSLFLAGRVTYIAVAGLPLALFIYWLRDHLEAPESAARFGLFLLALGMTALLQFLISYAMAMLAFWVLEVSTFIFILYALEYLASGHLFPLDILPPGLQQVLELTPFPYQLYFPISIYLGRVGESELWRGLLIQFVWVVIAYAVARFMWRLGIRRYEAVGG
ncbi:MAG: ABC-2 family transporter protein [Verrucomicrobia bacterium]|nr:ABC-2 family transporter protein [Verrucomicrobiota bacterium]